MSGVDLAQVRAAHERVAAHVVRTPVLPFSVLTSLQLASLRYTAIARCHSVPTVHSGRSRA